MAIVIDSVSIKGLRRTHFEQLLYHLERSDPGWYYGNKKQFKKRHDEIREWLAGIIETISGEGVVIPK